MLSNGPGGYALLERWGEAFVERVRRLSPARWLVLLAAAAAVLGAGSWLAFAPGSVPEVAADAGAAPAGAEVAQDDSSLLREREAQLEAELAERAQSLLARVTGEGRVAVRVRTELDPSEREETRERFDPDGQVERREERSIEPAGRVGASASSRSSERVEYDVGKQVTRAVTPRGALRRLHVAVLLDGKPGVEGAPGSGFSPWSASELAQLEALAKQAVGFSNERGDAFTLTSIPLQGVRPEGLQLGQRVVPDDVLRYAALLALVGALALLVMRSFGEPPVLAGLPMSVAELEAELLHRAGLLAELPAQGSAPRATLADEIAREVRPADAADAGAAALRAWLKQE